MKYQKNQKTRLQWFRLLFLITILGILFTIEGCKICGITTSPPSGIPKYAPFILEEDTLGNAVCTPPPGYYYTGKTQLVNLNYKRLNEMKPGDTAGVQLLNDSTFMTLRNREQFPLYTSLKFSIGKDQGDAILIYRGHKDFNQNGVFIGDIKFGNKHFELRKCDPPHYRLGQLDMAKLTTYNDLAPLPLDTTTIPANNCWYEQGNGQIDIMCMYTDSAKMQAKGQLKIEAQITLAVEKANEAFLSNGVSTRLHLNHLAEYTNYPSILESDSVSLIDKCNVIQSDSDLLDERNQVGSDLYFVFIKNGSEAYNGYSKPNKAFAVLKSDIASSSYLLAHEIGHLLGAKHDTLCYTTRDTSKVMGIMCNKDGYTRQVMYYLDDAGAICDPDLLTDLILNANRASGYMCRDIAPKVVLLDFFLDNGAEPSSLLDSSFFMLSPYIYIRQVPDSLRQFLYRGQDPVQGQKNYIYVMVRNGSNLFVDGSLTAYRYPAYLNPQMNEIDSIGTIPQVTLPPYSTEILEIEIPSNLYQLSGSAFLAYWRPVGVPTALPGDVSVFDMVVDSNQVAARAESIVSISRPLSSPSAWSTNRTDPVFQTHLKFRFTPGKSIRFRFTNSKETGNNMIADGWELNYEFNENIPLDSMKIINPNTVIFNPNGGSPWVHTDSIPNSIPINNQSDALFFIVLRAPQTAIEATYPVHLELMEGHTVIGAYNYKFRISN